MPRPPAEITATSQAEPPEYFYRPPSYQRPPDKWVWADYVITGTALGSLLAVPAHAWPAVLTVMGVCAFATLVGVSLPFIVMVMSAKPEEERDFEDFQEPRPHSGRLADPEELTARGIIDEV